jgi:hypothetical protein
MPANNAGINIKACAKMIGITPAEFNFRGIKSRLPPYSLLPITCFAYWIGILRVACVKAITATTIPKRANISIIKNIAFPGNLSDTSDTRANGSLDTIPIMISIDIPLPIPLSVIRSPNHIQNIVPAMIKTSEVT